MNTYIDDPWRELSRAVLKRAGDEARKGSVEAIYWLKDPETLDSFVLASGLDTRAVERFANREEQRLARARGARHSAAN